MWACRYYRRTLPCLELKKKKREGERERKKDFGLKMSFGLTTSRKTLERTRGKEEGGRHVVQIWQLPAHRMVVAEGQVLAGAQVVRTPPQGAA